MNKPLLLNLFVWLKHASMQRKYSKSSRDAVRFHCNYSMFSAFLSYTSKITKCMRWKPSWWRLHEVQSNIHSVLLNCHWCHIPAIDMVRRLTWCVCLCHGGKKGTTVWTVDLCLQCYLCEIYWGFINNYVKLIAVYI